MLRGTLALLIALFSVHASPAWGQLDLGGGQFGLSDAPQVFAGAVVREGNPPRLEITTEIEPGWYIYSITQKPGGPKPTKIELAASQQYELAGKFVANPAAKVDQEPDIWPGLPIEKHSGKVTWTAPLKLASGVAAKDVVVQGKVVAQACDPESCVDQTAEFTSKYDAAAVPQQPAVEPNRAAAEGVPKFVEQGVTLTGRATKVSLQPGETFELRVTVTPDAGWHAYALEEADTPKGVSMPGQFALTDEGGLRVAAPQADQQFKEKLLEWPAGAIDRYYQGPVTWTIPMTVPPDAAPGMHLLQGVVGYQVCADDESGCKQPTGAEFAVDVYVGPAPAEANGEIVFAKASYGDVRKIATAVRAVGFAATEESLAANAPGEASGDGEKKSKLTALVALPLAFLGGFILNFMPCVLPVIGLKVMGFVNQAGQNRSRIVALNSWFVLGLISVFMALACLVAFLNLGWGDQFQSPQFQVVLIAIVFVFALSMLGVWEVPLPGFVGSGKAADLANQEGASGAFFKGVLSTVLATPCLAPFISPVIGWSLGINQAAVFLIFFTIGLGMAFPYMVIAAYPKALKLLPKPGAWMDTFKHLMGFVLLFTVAYLFAVTRADLRVPTFVMLIALWAGCWWIGRVSLTENLGRKVSAYAFGSAFALIVGFGAFSIANYLDVVKSVSAEQVAGAEDGVEGSERDGLWQYYTPEKLADLRAEGVPTLIDFTASWCFTCQTNKFTALYRDETKKFMQGHGIVGLKADKSDPAPDVDSLLIELGQTSKGIPFYAIFPAGGGEPILMEGVLTQGRLLAALEKAVEGDTVEGPIAAKRDARTAMIGQ